MLFRSLLSLRRRKHNLRQKEAQRGCEIVGELNWMLTSQMLTKKLKSLQIEDNERRTRTEQLAHWSRRTLLFCLCKLLTSESER